MAKSSNKTVTKEIPTKPHAALTEGDDREIIALELPPEPLSPEMAAYFKKCEEKLGFVPNVLKAYAFDTAKLSAFVAMYNDLMLAPSGLSKLEREMIAVAVSSHNRCYYCLVAHGAAVRALSGDPALGELMVMNYRAARLSPRQRAMLDFAVKLSAEPWRVEDEDRAVLRRAGFSDRDIWDIAAVANAAEQRLSRPGEVNGSKAKATAVMTKSSSSLIMPFSNHELRRLAMRAIVARVLAGHVLAGTALSAVLVTCVVAAPAPAKPAAAKLSPTDIQNTFFTGQPFTATTPSKLKFKMTFMADGKMKRQPIGTGSRGEGTWKLSKDGFCTMWKGGKDSCFTVVSAGDSKWSVLKGSTIMATWSK